MDMGELVIVAFFGNKVERGSFAWLPNHDRNKRRMHLSQVA